MALIVDASVVLKWVLPEPGTEKAITLFDLHASKKIELYAPILLLYEVTNTIALKKDLSSKQVKDALAIILDERINLVSMEIYMQKIAQAVRG
ncbi:MAG: type II toxin-antitoxin system VapC family toxin [Pseudomonadales bacterium]|nr:type II toxin-antitoxin system VapC family toxin [Pseudomonadales bacterium]